MMMIIKYSYIIRLNYCVDYTISYVFVENTVSTECFTTEPSSTDFTLITYRDK